MACTLPQAGREHACWQGELLPGQSLVATEAGAAAEGPAVTPRRAGYPSDQSLRGGAMPQTNNTLSCSCEVWSCEVWKYSVGQLLGITEAAAFPRPWGGWVVFHCSSTASAHARGHTPSQGAMHHRKGSALPQKSMHQHRVLTASTQLQETFQPFPPPKYIRHSHTKEEWECILHDGPAELPGHRVIKS